MAQQHHYPRTNKSIIQTLLSGGRNKSPARRKNSMDPPPSFRIVLVGHDWVQKNKVGNVLLGRDVFETSTKSPAKNYNTRFTGYVVDRYITVVNTAELFTSDPSDNVLNQRVKECVSLCAPGPHAFVLVVNPDFKEPERQRMEYIVNSFSEYAFQHSIVFIYKEQKQHNGELENIITLCGGKKHQYGNNEINEKNQMDTVKAIEEMVSMNKLSFVNCDMYEEAKEMYTNEPSRQEDRDREALHVISSSSDVVSTGHISSERLNLVLCGSNAAAKASAADLILGLGEQTEPSPQPSSACVKREAEVCGRQVTLVLLPSLGETRLSEEALLQEILQCFHLCDPGVHAFLLVNPQGPQTDEYKMELKRFEHFFGKEADAFCETVLTSGSEEYAQGGGERGHHILDHNSKVLLLLERVEKMREKNDGCFTSDMYISAQLKTLLKCHSQLEEMNKTIQTLKGSNQGNTDGFRIVLLGKTGAGKSATGNTILGGDVFKEVLSSKSVTTECRKETAMINGRQITVVDTPGLFDTACDQEETKKEIIRCIAMAAPGPHVFLLVVALGRFTQEERDAVEIIQSMFGEESGKYTVVLFTRGDDLTGTTLDQYLEDADEGINSLLRKCGKRHHLFNNRDKSSSIQVPKLLDKIDAMLRANGGKYYTTEMFQKTEEALKQEQERILKEREEEIKKEKEELQAKHEAEMEKLKREMEEERRTQEEDRRRREEESKQDLKKAIKDLEEEERRKRTEMEENYNVQKQQNEDWKKQRTEDIRLERQRQLEEWERKTQAEQRRLEEEEKQRNMKYVEKQRQEEEKFNLEKDKRMKEAEEEKRKKQQEYEDRVKKEEERRKYLEEKIKYAEKSRVKDLEEQKRKHEEECQKEREKEEKRREEDGKKWEELIQSKEKKWSADQERLRQEKERYEREQLKQLKKRDAKEKKRKQEQEDERKKIEQGAQKQIKEKEDEMKKLELQLQEEERKSRDRKEEMDEQLRKQREQFEAEKQKEAEASEEKERRDVEYLKQLHEKEKDNLKRETEMAARMQAEKEFNEQLDEKVKEAKTQGHKEGHKEGKEEGHKEGKEEGHKEGKEEGHKEGKEEGHKEGCDKGREEVESKRTKPGRGVDKAINRLFALFEDDKKSKPN